MNDQEISILKQSVGSDPKIKRNSGLFSFLRWFKSSSRESVSSEVQNSASGTSGSTDSINSAGTVASFSFVPPTAYAKNKVSDNKCLTPSPETDTYKARLKQRDQVRERDKNVTLRKKYNLFFNRDTCAKREQEGDNSKSLPLMTRKMEDERGHRRTNSDSSKTKKSGAYLHVKGKRRAPQPPPKNPDSTLSLRRKKRLAPQPPSVSTEKVMNTFEYADADIVSNDYLKLQNGMLKPVKEVGNNSPNTSARSSLVEAPVSPRPWYKRNSRDSASKKENKYEPVELKIEKKEEKRKSGLMFLTNISELDREACEIIKNERKHEIPEFMRPKEEPSTDTFSPKRKSAKDLIAKFNAITNVTKVTVNSAFFGARETSVFQKRDYFGRKQEDINKKSADNARGFLPLAKAETSACIIKPPTPKPERKSWFCPKCNLENDYWRIICHVCSTIKPYFDDLTAPPPKNNPIEKNVPENNEIKPDGAQNSDNNHLERSKTQIGFSALANYNEKQEEREKLKKMLIEMKNSLPKRKPNHVNVNRKSTIAENPEISDPNINNDDKLLQIDKNSLRKDAEITQIKPAKVSSSAQTSSVLKKPNFQLMRPKDFEDIYSEKSGKPSATHLYANLAHNENLFLNVPKRFSDIKNNFNHADNADTLEINRLLRRLENAIAKGDLSDAAVYARELAQLKINCSVIRQKSVEIAQEESTNGYMVEMYVEDRLSHRGPFPIRVKEMQTVCELKKQVEKEFEIPVAVQRWILGKELATSDIATLKDHNVTTNGCPVFLYLVAPNNANAKQPETIANETKELNVVTKKEVTEKKENNLAPRIVEEKFKPIDQIIDDKSKRILKINETIPIKTEPTKSDNILLKSANPASGSKCKEKTPPKAIEEDFTEYDKTLKPAKSWACKICTLINPLTTNICLVCASVHQKDSTKSTTTENKHYLELVNLDHSDLVPNTEPFECLVCLTTIQPKMGVTLRECLHQFCRICLEHTIEFNDEVVVKCPFRDEQYSCDIALQDREIKALVSTAVYDQYLARSVAQAENKMDKSFHCKTPDCRGWCIFEDNVNEFRCPVCRRNNCLTCQAIHDGLNCKQYQERMNAQSETDEDAKRTRVMLEEMVNKGEALTCPACQVILMKKWGCDWVRCSMCKTEICWVTRGLRWGPGGKGDTTGGCKCGVNGVKCHPQCNYCH